MLERSHVARRIRADFRRRARQPGAADEQPRRAPVLKQHTVVSARVPSPPESNPSQQRSLFQVTGVAPPLVAPNVPVSWLPKYRCSVTAPGWLNPEKV